LLLVSECRRAQLFFEQVITIDLLSRSLELYQNAQFENSLDVLESVDSHPYAALLCTRILGRLGRNAEAIERLESSKFSFHGSVDLAIEHAIVRTFPYLSLGDFSKAEAAIDSAKQLLRNEHSATVEAELHYVDAARYFALGDYTATERAADRALSASDDFFSSRIREPQSASVLAHNRVKALQILALLHSRKQRYHEQARLIRLALVELQRSSVPDAYTSAFLKMNLSFYVRDLDSQSDLHLLDRHSWPVDLDLFAAEIDRSIAFLNAVQGDITAFRESMASAASNTKSIAFRSLLSSESCTIERYAFDVTDEKALNLGFSQLISDDVDHDEYTEDAILSLAQELSYVDSGKALILLDKREQMNRRSSWIRLHDDREKADAQFAVAIVFKNSGRPAVDDFFEAFETWNNVGYRKKAAMAAIELAELTHNPAFAAYARREAELRPGSWLDLRVRRMNV